MKTENKELLGFTVPVVGIVETLSEAIEKAGSETAVLKDYVSNVLAHSHYTILRRTIVKKLVELTGIKQLTEKDGEKEVIVEKDASYIARLQGEIGESGLKGHEAAIAAACALIPVDYTPGTRGAGGSTTPAKKWLAYYDQLVAEEKLDSFCSKYEISQEGKSEEEFKNEVANKCRELVTAAQARVAQQALDV